MLVNPFGKPSALHSDVGLPSGRELGASFHQSSHPQVVNEMQTGKLPHGLRGMTVLQKPQIPSKDAGLSRNPSGYRRSSQVAVADPAGGSRSSVVPREQPSGKKSCRSPNREEDVHTHSPLEYLEDADHNNPCDSGSCAGTLSEQATGHRRREGSPGMTNSETEGHHLDTPHSAASELGSNAGDDQGDSPQSVAVIQLNFSRLPLTSAVPSEAEGGPGSLPECAWSQSSSSSVLGADRQKRIPSLFTIEAAEGTRDTLRVVQLRRRKRLRRSECIRPYSLLASAQPPNRISESQLVRQTNPSWGVPLRNTAPQSGFGSLTPSSVLDSFSRVGRRDRSDEEAGPAGEEQQPPSLQLDTPGLLTGGLQRQPRESLSSDPGPRGSTDAHSYFLPVFGPFDKQRPTHLGEADSRRNEEDSGQNPNGAMVRELTGSLRSLNKRRDDRQTSEEEVTDLGDDDANEEGAKVTDECARKFTRREKAEVNPGDSSLVTVGFRRVLSTSHSSGDNTRSALQLFALYLPERRRSFSRGLDQPRVRPSHSLCRLSVPSEQSLFVVRSSQTLVHLFP